MDTNHVLIFRPKPGHTFKLLILGFLFVVVGIALIFMSQAALGWITIIFFGMALIASISMLLPGSTCIRLTEKGFEVRRLYRGWFIDWNEIRQFGYGSIKRTEMIVYELNSDSPNKKKAWTNINSSLTGADGGFDTLGHPAKELIKVFNEWKEKYAGHEVKRTINN